MLKAIVFFRRLEAHVRSRYPAPDPSRPKQIRPGRRSWFSGCGTWIAVTDQRRTRIALPRLSIQGQHFDAAYLGLAHQDFSLESNRDDAPANSSNTLLIQLGGFGT